MNFGDMKDTIRAALPKRIGPHGGYFDDSSRIPNPVEIKTPYIDHLRQIARIWRGVTLAAGMFAAAGWGAFVWQTQQSTVDLYVVEIDKFGEPGQLQEMRTYSPTTDRYRRVVHDVIEDAFAISTDHQINKERYQRLRSTLRAEAGKAWGDWWQENKDSLPAARTVEIITSRPTANANVWLVVWKETDYETVSDYLSNKPKLPVRRLSGEITLEHRKPKNSTEMRENVFGIWVVGMNFSPEN